MRFSLGISTPSSLAMKIGLLDYPCRCLWRGFLQITRTTPWRRMTRQDSHSRLTEGRTFIRFVVESQDRWLTVAARNEGKNQETDSQHRPGWARGEPVTQVFLKTRSEFAIHHKFFQPSGGRRYSLEISDLRIPSKVSGRFRPALGSRQVRISGSPLVISTVCS